MKSTMTTFYIVRHGETEWNVKGLLQGHADSPLTKQGMQQAKKIATELKSVIFDGVFSSDLLRAKRTAEIITLEKKLAIKTTEALRERSYGIFEGKPYANITAALQKLLKKHKLSSAQERYTLTVDASMETIENSVSRFITYLREIAVGYPQKTVLIVSHGGIMRYFLIHLGFGTHETLPHGSINNTAYIKLESDGVDFFVKETSGIHLPK